MSVFDPKTFAEMTFNESNSTESVLVPVGEYQALIDSWKIDSWKTKDGAKAGLKLQVIHSILDEGVKAITGRDVNKVRQEIMLDLTEQGGLDMAKGMNVTLGRLREAADCNQPGQPFSFGMLQGRMVKVSVSHRPDSQDPTKLYTEVRGTARP